MCDASPFEPATSEEIEAGLAEATRSSAGGQMTRNVDVFLAGVSAKHLSERLALAGFVAVRHAADQGHLQRESSPQMFALITRSGHEAA